MSGVECELQSSSLNGKSVCPPADRGQDVPLPGAVGGLEGGEGAEAGARRSVCGHGAAAAQPLQETSGARGEDRPQHAAAGQGLCAPMNLCCLEPCVPGKLVSGKGPD